MTDFVSLKRNLIAEKERLEHLNTNLKQKFEGIVKEIASAIDYLDKTEEHFKKLEKNLTNRKNDELQLEEEKKGLLQEIESLKEQIERINLSINDEDEKIRKLTEETEQLAKTLDNKKSELSSLEQQIQTIKDSTKTKLQEKEEVKNRMNNRIQDAQKILQQLLEEKEQDTKISPVLDFLLKEVRIDIPEVDILATLAYRNQAMGLEELKKAVSKTPPVIILKAIRNLDSKGIVKYDERLDTIEITANLV